MALWGSSPRPVWGAEEAPGARSRHLLALPRLEVPHGRWPGSWVWTWGRESRNPESGALASGWVGQRPGAMREALWSQPLLWPPSLTDLFEEVFSDPVSSPFACMLEVPQKVGLSPSICPWTWPSSAHASLTWLDSLVHPLDLSRDPSAHPLNAYCWPPSAQSIAATT